MSTPQADPTAQLDGVTVARGNIYLSREIHEICLKEANCVALLARDDSLLIVPLMKDSAGGLLLKIRNARGDRVIHAQEFFRAQGLAEDFETRAVRARWSAEAAALVITDLLRGGT